MYFCNQPSQRNFFFQIIQNLFYIIKNRSTNSAMRIINLFIRGVFPFLFVAILIYILLFFYEKPKENKYSATKREMRAAWITTYRCIDWPSKWGLTTEDQKKELVDIFDLHQRNGMNAIIFQVRPSGDALYQSDIEPWGEWLSGTQGETPNPFYDPLAFAIELAHERNMEFHAWFNPYRAQADTVWSILDSSHIINHHPEWFVIHGRKRYFNPGIPEVREYLVKVVVDVVKRYDIDAVHFDDYFYPYPVDTLFFDDLATFKKYQGNFTDRQLNDWRRNNVNLTIQMISKAIKETKPWVKFGISPHGVWRNEGYDPRGSKSRGAANYDDLFADVLLWLEKGWIDYITPQLYWHIGNRSAPYEVMLEWWRNYHYNRHLYIGEGIYMLDSTSYIKAWRTPDEIFKHIEMCRQAPDVKGYMFYNTRAIQQNFLGINELLKQNYFQNVALIPVMEWIDSVPPLPPAGLKVTQPQEGIKLSWVKNDTLQNEFDKHSYYIVYRFEGQEVGELVPENMVAVVRNNAVTFKRNISFLRKKYTFVVTGVDRLHNESAASQPIIIRM